MRSIRLFLCVILCALSISSNAQRTLSEVASMKGVTSVFIGKTMLDIAGGSISICGDQSALDFSKILKDLTSIEIIQCENNEIAKKVQKKCKSILSKYPLEVITEVTDDGQNIEISGVFDKDGKNLNMLLIAVTQNKEPVYILLKGKIDIVTLNNALINK